MGTENNTGQEHIEYSINESWLNRVNEAVDYAIDNGMYVIIRCRVENNCGAFQGL